jgi:hypothetical protein
MKISLLFCLVAVAQLAPAQNDSKKTTAPAPRTAPAEVKIPAGAVKTEDGSYKFTDPKGKKWIYRQTPFGIAKSEDKPADPTATPFGNAKLKPASEAPKPVEGKELTVAYDEGDTVRFERPTPFGTNIWRKKKTELDASEKKILENQILDQKKSRQQ